MYSSSFTQIGYLAFVVTQAEEKLQRENIKGKDKANLIQNKVVAKVKQTINELGGIIPENQHTPKNSVKQLEGDQKKLGDGE